MILKLLTTAVATLLLGVGIFLAGPQIQQAVSAPLVGTFSPTGGGTYRLGQSIGISDSSFKLSSFKEPVSNIPYTMAYLGSDVGYGTISPQTSVSEFVSFTGVTQNSDGSALLTGVSRGISRTPGSGGCVASTTLAQAHAGQSIFILSNQPCFYVNEFVALRTVSTSTAATVISSTTPWHYDSVGVQANGSAISTTSEFASVAYVNAVSFAGTSNASQTVKGIVELATGAEAGSSTPTGSTGAAVALSSLISTSSPFTAGSYAVMTQPNGKIRQNFFDLTEIFTVSGIWTFSATATMATTTMASSTITHLYAPTASTTNLTNSGTASTTNLIVSNTVTLSNPCTGCTITAGISTSTTFTAPNSTIGVGTVTKDIFCVSPKIVVGGGFSGLQAMGLVGNQVTTNGPISSTAWRLVVACAGSGGGSCAGETITGYALCVNP